MAHTQSPHSLTVTHFLLVFGASHYRKKGKRQLAAKKFAPLPAGGPVAAPSLSSTPVQLTRSVSISPMYSRLSHPFLFSNFSSLVFILSFFLSFFFCWAVFVLKRVGRFLFVCSFVRLDSECIKTKPASGLILTVVLKAWMVS